MQRFVLFAALAACGSKDEAPKPDKVPATKPPDPGPGPSEKPPSIDKPVRTVRPPVANFDRGKCTFTVSGTVSGEYTSPGSSSAVLASYWVVEPKAREMMFKNGEEGLIINCGDSKGASLSFTARVKNKDELPYGPKKYEIGKGKKPIHVLGTINNNASIMSSEGSLEITAYDAAHIAGTFELEAELLGTPKGPVEIKGSFDYKCPNKCN